MTVTIDLSGRTAIVTGASNGIGRATAILLAEQGATVLAADFQQAKENADRFDELGIVDIPCDVRRETELSSAIDQAVERTGRLVVVDEAREIHEIYEAELAKKGVKCNMKAFIPYCTGDAGVTEERFT